MNNTLIINDGNYEMSMKFGNILSLILISAKNIDVNYAPIDISNYNNIVLVFSTYGINTRENVKEYLAHVKYMIGDVKLAIVCIGKCENINEYLNEIYKIIERKADLITFVDKKEMEEYKTEKKRKNFKNSKDIDYMIQNVSEVDVIKVCDSICKFFNKSKKKMPKEELLIEITKFIKEHNTCALATGNKDFIRNTPMKYIYYKRSFYFVTQEGYDFKGILQNSNVSIAIFNNHISMDNILGMQILGKGEVVSKTSDEYLEVIEKNNIKIESDDNLSISINLLKVVPDNIEFTNSEFKKNGFDSKQTCDLLSEM